MYKLIEERRIHDINSLGRVYRHDSGARVLYIKNGDDNKVFFAGFRTPSVDSSGAAHITEHSVLSGSEKFPCKDNFNEMAKGSLHTFLNAMTYGDRTVYPIGSRNNKDFMNLMELYLDAVFRPLIYARDEIFHQEGIIRSIADADSDIKYNGIVYNEMKGAFSDKLHILYRYIGETLFPDTENRHVSGGYPPEIPRLTYEAFLDFHKAHYSPENAYIYLYGDLDIDGCLAFIEREYLSNPEAVGKFAGYGQASYKIQPPPSAPKFAEGVYPLPDGEAAGEGDLLAACFVYGKTDDSEELLALSLLGQLLFTKNSAPVKKALLEAGFGEELLFEADTEFIQPNITIVMSNSTKTAEEFHAFLFGELKKIIDGGISKDYIASALNKAELRMREENYGHQPRGLKYGLQALASWIYGGDPFAPLERFTLLASIREKALNGGYFEGLARRAFLDNPHAAFITLKPKKGLIAEEEARVANELAETKQNLSKQELDKLIGDTRRLREFHEAKDSDAAIASIPTLALSDIDREPQRYHCEKTDGGFLYSEGETNEMSYLSAMYPLTGLSAPEIQAARILVQLFGKLATKRESLEELNNELDNYAAFSFDFQSVYSYADGSYTPYLFLGIKYLNRNFAKAAAVVGKILANTDFSDKVKIRELMNELKMGIRREILSSGHVYALRRSRSVFSDCNAAEELFKGSAFAEYLEDILNSPAKFEEMADSLERVRDKVFRAPVVHLTSDRKASALDLSFLRVGSGPAPSRERLAWEGRRNSGLMTSSQVQYNAVSADFSQKIEKLGQWHVLRGILDAGYLMTELRVKGGAYGLGLVVSDNRLVSMFSYRDPKCRETYGVYYNAAEFLSKFSPTEDETRKYIIGAINVMDKPQHVSMRGKTAMLYEMSGIGYERTREWREQILSFTSRDAAPLSAAFEDLRERGNICTIGNENIIKNETIFENRIKYSF